MPDSPRQISFQAAHLTKKFGRKNIFNDINLTLSGGDSLAITGINGSGKSTLIKILSGILNATSGELNFSINNNPIPLRLYYNYIGFVSPYLSLYDEFTGYENLKVISNIRGNSSANIENVLRKTGLYDRKDELLKIYSSGMKQRLKIAFAILHDPPVLLLDEPSSNLDSDGIRIVNEIADEYKKGRIMVIATNDNNEKSLCGNELNLSGN